MNRLKFLLCFVIVPLLLHACNKKDKDNVIYQDAVNQLQTLNGQYKGNVYTWLRNQDTLGQVYEIFDTTLNELTNLTIDVSKNSIDIGGRIYNPGKPLSESLNDDTIKAMQMSGSKPYSFITIYPKNNSVKIYTSVFGQMGPYANTVSETYIKN